MKRCESCGTNLKADLFSAEPVCSICKVKFIGCLPTTPKLIALARARLGLTDGDYLQQDKRARKRFARHLYRPLIL